ncbi:MAG: DNA-directed RNA polymerase subunit N [Candidatus Diapherotrites archaeon]|nr:DNA-directed RNA polymerase subunit N [Candidatus Diapherotrites archaeon]
MEIPVRCFTCGKLIGNLYEDFKKRVSKGEDAGEVLDELGLENYCCRRMFLSQPEIREKIRKYNR